MHTIARPILTTYLLSYLTMSFWKRTLLGSDEMTGDLPNTTTAKNDSPPAAAAVGPPPTATAYTHSSTPREPPQKPKPPQEQPPPPTFHIFQPKPQEETTASPEDDEQDAVEQTVSSGDTEEPIIIGQEEVEKQQDSEWDFDDPELSQELGADDSSGEDDEFRNDDVQIGLVLDTLKAVEEITVTITQHESIDDESAPSYLAHEADELDKNAHKTDRSTVDRTDCDQTITPLQNVEETAMVLTQTEMEATSLAPKFDFLNESVPLQQLQDSTSKRRHESLTRIHELDCKLASFQAKLAHESMDRGKALNMARLDDCVTKPLEDAVEQFPLLVHQFDGQVHSRLLKLEAARMRHTHVELPDAVTDELESPHEYITQELHALIRLEHSKEEKRNGSMVRRFESVAGTAARRYQEEAVSRRAALVQVQSLVQDAADLDERRALEFLESLKELRESLQREREERKARDKEIMELIVERTTELKRALLQAAGST